jgi:hypothetical protein
LERSDAGPDIVLEVTGMRQLEYGDRSILLQRGPHFGGVSS